MLEYIECVPNFSVGNDPKIIKAIAVAITKSKGVQLLHIDSSNEVARTVMTIMGQPFALAEAMFAAIATATRMIDLTDYNSAHPNIGATDVCPFVPLNNSSMQTCIALARSLAKRVGGDLKLPTFLYGEAAINKNHVQLANIRRGGRNKLKERIADQSLIPDFGPHTLDMKQGAIVIGARKILIAYNLNFESPDLKSVQTLAQALAKLPKVQAIAWQLPSYGIYQIATNLIDYQVTNLHHLYATAETLATQHKVKLIGSEVVGLLPVEALRMAHPNGEIAKAIEVLGLNSDHPANRVFRRDHPFDPSVKILDKYLKDVE